MGKKKTTQEPRLYFYNGSTNYSCDGFKLNFNTALVIRNS